MKRIRSIERLVHILLLLLLIVPWVISGCGKEKKVTTPKESPKQEVAKTEGAARRMKWTR